MSASSIPGANVISDPIIVSDDDFDGMDSPLESELAGRAVDLQQVELSHYRYA